MIDLFGREVPEPTVHVPGKRKPTVPKGYAAQPGSGPDGETCKTCAHYTRVHYQAGIFRKCGLNEAKWTHGPGSDIKARSPACAKWERDAS
jgi:hypothetical protein